MAYQTLLTLPLAALTLLGVEERARACQPPPPQLLSTRPADGSTYPGNAAVFFYGYAIKLDNVTVTVDDKPASFGPPPAAVASLVGNSVGNIVVTIQPTPMAGQKVVIQGSFCDIPASCQKMVTFTAGPPDTDAPPPVDVISFDTYDYPDYMVNGGSCTISSDLAY